MLYRTLVAGLSFLIAPAVLLGKTAPKSTPSWCCPNQCQTDDGDAKLVPREDGSGELDLIINEVRVPIMSDAFVGSSEDGNISYCIGYDSFGSRQIKCLFVSAAV